MAWLPVAIRFYARCLGLNLALCLAASAQINSPWRFWDTSDGFLESYTSSVVPSPGGDVWVKHGDVGRIDLLNGYSAPQYPDPGGYGKIECAPDGTVWMWSGGLLKRLQDSRWTSFAVDDVTRFGALRASSDESWEITSGKSPFLRTTISVVALDRNHALIMLPDRILEFDARHSGSRSIATLAETGLTRFVAMRAAPNGAIWLTGRGGLGRLSQLAQGNAGSRDLQGHNWHWETLPRAAGEWVEFSEPFAGAGNELFVTGIALSHARAALNFDGRRWTEVYRSESGTLRAWPGGKGSIWIQDGNAVIELAGGRKTIAEKTGSLSGVLLGVTPQGLGQFWVASSQGLAHYMPPLWQTPAGAPLLDDVVNAISEDRSGNLWFVSPHALTRFNGSAWSSYPLPKGETAWSIFTEGPGVLPDGRLVILTTFPHLLIFDPALHTFRAVEHPGKRTPRLFIPQADGTLIVETYPTGSGKGVALETFDGRQFRPLLEAGKIPDDLRNLRMGSNGEIWVGGTSFFGVYRDSRFRKLAVADGFGDPGAYNIHEDPSGVLTVGGQDGLYRLEGQKWRRLRSGLDRVRNIVTARDGSMWVASGTGIHRYRNGIWVTNGLEEGLPSSVAYKVFEDSKGRIWAGTTRGLSVFNADADADPPLAILTEDQNPREAPPGGKVRLVFSGIDRWKFTLASRLLFSHRLDSGSWTSFAPEISASYDKLASGRHRFEVRAMDRNGNISLVPAIHNFLVLLPWYATQGFRWLATGAGAIIVLLVTLAFVSYAHRGSLIRKLNQKNKLERDRQAILEMVARREPLPDILRQIADSVVENCRGATCVIIREHEHAPEIFSQPPLTDALRQSIDRLSPRGTAGGLRPSGEWLQELCSVLRDYFTGACPVVPICSGNREVLGAIALFFPRREPLSDSGHWLLETFSGMAAAAIENARLYERLAHQARHDFLTGLPNRLYFDDQLQSAVSAAKPADQSLAVLYLDLDRFKQINDSLGHRTGDLLLMQVAIRLSGVLNSGATLARIGGDEFTVLMEQGVDKASVERVASTMLEALRSPIEIEGETLFASASIGISFFPEDGETPSALQKHADIAMYRAKARGKNCLEFFSAEMGSKTEAALTVQQILRRAVDERGFELYYQPQFDLSGRMEGFEALLRLDQPGRGPISPAEFIPIAEETGLIVPIGAWVLGEACRQLREWLDDGLPATRVSINVSALEIARESFADDVAQVLSQTRLAPDCLELELTESAIVQNLPEATKQMQRLRSLGVRLAIDDFGTGYSSFAHLQTLPLDALKIDRSFIQGVAGSTGSSPLVRTIVDLGRNLGLKVVVEGVETDEQFAVVRESGCDLVQGYLLGRPQKAAHARSLLVAEHLPVPAGVR